MGIANTHYVCLPCRASYKKGRDPGRRHVCPRCDGDLLHAGTAFAAPKRRDAAAWRAVGVVLRAGLDYDQSCCGCGPGYRPRSPREIRDRQAYALRTGRPLARALATPDPWGAR
ncbi:deoxyxylulose-5-phosphate synthase [Streptomyces sp. NPDC051940]|uniref:deoxyxylulose-5-phosphate synthase n=1 Tax=Streptomyces sp. NPDC051940 TaxID=3155675 RepID=UPI003417EAFE